MRHPLISRQQIPCAYSSQFPTPPRQMRDVAHVVMVALTPLLLGISVSWAGRVVAQTPPPRPMPTRPVPARPVPTNPAPASPTPATPAPMSEIAAPTELSTVIEQIDSAANRHDVAAVMQFYSRNLTHSDGLTFQNMQRALTRFWERFPDATYQTELNSWERNGNAIVVQTTTTITGTQRFDNRDLRMTATLRSRQRLENGKIVRQDILAERSQLVVGENPPQVNVQLPEQVSFGREFSFDAIVQEPLGDRLLLGTAIEEPVRAAGYLTSAQINLELLSAGGLFKVGRAPAVADARWISAVLAREDGIVIETRRLSIVNRNPR